MRKINSVNVTALLPGSRKGLMDVTGLASKLAREGDVVMLQ